MWLGKFGMTKIPNEWSAPTKPSAWVSGTSQVERVLNFYKPVFLTGVDKIKVGDYLMNKIQGWIRDGGIMKTITCGVGKSKEEIIGFILSYPDKFDTKELKVSVWKIPLIIGRDEAVKKKLVQSLSWAVRLKQKSAKKKEVYLFTRIPSKDQETIEVLLENGFIPIETLVTFGAAIDEVNWPSLYGSRQLVSESCPEGHFPNNLRLEISPPSFSDLKSIFRISDESFSHSRFRNDPTLSLRSARRIYRSWLRTSFEKKRLLVARFSGVPIGFVSWDIDEGLKSFFGFAVGSIGLIAVAREFLGRKVGKQLFLSAVRAMKDKGAKYLTVGTQLSNQSAINLYKSLGLKEKKSEVSLRKWLR